MSDIEREMPQDPFQAIIDSQFGRVDMATDTEILQMETIAQELLRGVPGEVMRAYGHETEQGYLSFRTRIDEKTDSKQTQSIVVIAGGAFNKDLFMIIFDFKGKPMQLGLPEADDEQLVIDILEDVLEDTATDNDERAIIGNLQGIMEFVRGGIDLDGLGQIKKRGAHVAQRQVSDVIADCVAAHTTFAVRAVEHSVDIDADNRISVKSHEVVGTYEPEDFEDLSLPALVIQYKDVARDLTYEHCVTLTGDRNFQTFIGDDEDDFMDELESESEEAEVTIDNTGLKSLTRDNVQLLTAKLFHSSLTKS